MRRIYITPTILEVAKSYNENLFSERKDNFKKPIDTNKTTGKLIDLENYLRLTVKNIKYADYVKNIITYYDDINIIKPSEFNYYFTNYFNFTEKELSKKVNDKYGNKEYPSTEFYKLVVAAMRYESVREYEYIKVVNDLNIKTCVYCNSQFAITVLHKITTTKAAYELDHFFPKSKYPFLCTSFFNLQPCCSTCNKSKSKNESLFNLFTEKNSEIDEFYFTLDKKSILLYYLTLNNGYLKVSFDSSSTKLLANHERLFNISEIYTQHTDVIEEILQKKRIYTKSYINLLQQSFNKLFSSKQDFNRLLLGTYEKPSQIHKRPLSKLIQDISKQVGLL